MSLLAFLLLTAQAAPQPATLHKPRLVCRASETRLGTRVRAGRRCKTAEEWEQEDAERERVPVTLRVTAGQGDPAQPTRQPQ